jgi:hypothetical protein
VIGVDFYSLVSLPIEIYSGEYYLSNATGFFLNFEQGLFFVSNWHVFSGRDANTGQPLDGRMLIPDRLDFPLHGKELGATAGVTSLKIRSGETNLWLQHQAGQEYDIACMRISETPPEAVIKVAYDYRERSKLKMTKEIGSDCFIVGHPVRGKLTDILPVWKRATLASEFLVPWRGKECFLVDTTTSDGMSGSPVYLRKSGSIQFEGSNSKTLASDPVTEFMGIYSGRLKRAAEGILDIGIVWKTSLLEEMIATPVLGDHVIRAI